MPRISVSFILMSVSCAIRSAFAERTIRIEMSDVHGKELTLHHKKTDSTNGAKFDISTRRALIIPFLLKFASWR